jgi:transcription elongation factor Elf1
VDTAGILTMRGDVMSNSQGLICAHCGSDTIYLSVRPTDLQGTLTCLICGETEDAMDGIKKGGETIKRKGWK